MEKIKKSFLLIGFLMALTSCVKADDEPREDPSPDFVESYIAGTTTAQGSTRYSPFLINFENDSVANFVSSTRAFPGSYSFESDTLTFQTDDREKVAVFAIENDEIVHSHYEVRFYNEDGSYEPAPVKYDATGELGQTPETNQLAGKTFMGDQFKFGTEGVFQEGFTYAFSTTENTYGSGTDDIAENELEYQSFNNVGFRFEEGGTKEFGVLIDGKLVAFKSSGLFYWGTYDLQ